MVGPAPRRGTGAGAGANRAAGDGKSWTGRPAPMLPPGPTGGRGFLPGATGGRGFVPGVAGAPVVVAPAATRRIRVFARSDVPVQAQWFPDPNSRQWIAVIDSGVNVVVDGLHGFKTVDVSTDRLVIWTAGVQEPDLTGRTQQDQATPLEFYMEGNIVFREGDRVIYADRMYYDVTHHVGTVLNADILSPVPTYAGLLRVHADVVQQTASDRFFAENAFFTSSRMGEPSYRLQAGDVYFEDLQSPMVDAWTGQPVFDPTTGQQAIQHQRLMTAQNDVLYVESVPVFYWPTIATDLNDPSYFLRRATIRSDTVFGTEQLLTDWDGYQLLGIKNKPKGTDLDLSLDYLSARGLGYGATYKYDLPGLFGIPGPTAGLIDYWGIQDHGTDNLGQGRGDVPPEASYRFRLFGQDREILPYDFQLTAELGWLSDRNFLQEY